MFLCLKNNNPQLSVESIFRHNSELRFAHFTVNHSEGFVNYNNGLHTQNIESCGTIANMLLKYIK
ncbi:hypothetical protein A0H76_1551 [Hepatospora eriocheir]|uniref:Uncharacterized protein n=1 Tax=Hepatospora eriocheir TaxID=1081669 RepID=A0A1X0Q5R9_9MICR|nr:hypothetical protein A0H76_1551 [Hepatospora eriocheir]